MKKIIALIMALALVMGLAITASAQTIAVTADGPATITITNASRGETYSVYKVFGATVTGAEEGGSIAYTGDVPESLSNYFVADSAGNISKKADVTDKAILGALKTWSTTAGAVTSVQCTDGSALVFTGLDYGYYVVLSSQGKEGDAAHGAAITVTSTNPTATIVDKNSTTPANLTKTIDKPNVSFGDTVTYTVTFKTSNYDGAGTAAKKITKYTIEDTLPDFLSNVTVTSIKVDDTAIETKQFENKKIDIAWVDKNNNSLYNNGATVTITYTAKITEKAAIAGNGNENKVTLTWTKENDTNLGGGTVDFEKKANTSTYALALKKVNQSGTNLAGATFQFPFYVKETVDADGAYIYAGTTAGDGLTNTITTPASGEIVVKGVASGTYKVTETAAPNGYNKLTGDVAITVTKTEETTTSVTKHLDANGNIVETGTDNAKAVTYTNNALAASVQIVVNKTGSALPSTGGIGTTLFYVIGGLLMTSAAVLLITKKRMPN